MGQVTIYLDERTQKLLDKAVTAAGVSKSRYVAGLILRHAGDDWPEAGAWDERFPDQEAIRAGLGCDVARERL
jgi:hypothetical protein